MAMRITCITVLLLGVAGETIIDQFLTKNTFIWNYADQQLFKQFAPVYYMNNHSSVDSELSKSEGNGLQIVMSDIPCKYNTQLCKGADMASDHLRTMSAHSYGDFEARIRAPHVYPGDGSKCDDGIYGYFTAGYVRGGAPSDIEYAADNLGDGYWNEMNFGFHPDRDQGGTMVSVELHADTGGYKEALVQLPFNYRDDFHTYRIKYRKCDVSWWVDGKCVHVMKECLSHPMYTSLILRTNKKGSMNQAKMEFAYFKYTPYQDDKLESPANVSLAEHIAWHDAQEVQFIV